MTALTRPLLACALCFATILAGAGCGPSAQYGSLRDAAKVDLERARARDAEHRAPFEWTLASEYFAAAAIAEDKGNWPAALKWIRAAKKYAAEAVELTGGRGVQPAPIRPNDVPDATPVEAK